MKHVLIEFEAYPNENGDGWLPVIYVDGDRVGSTWAARGYDEDDALSGAEVLAEAEAERFIGDYEVEVAER